MDKITIGIPTLNNPQRLYHCLEAIYKTHDMGKPGREISVLVVDDGSDDANLIKNKHVCAIFSVNLLLHNQRLGVPTAWNTLINHNKSEFNILINDDVYVANNWIDVVLYTLKNNESIGVVGLNAYEGDNSRFPSNNTPTYIESNILIGSDVAPVLSARGFAFGFRYDDYKKINGFDQRFFCFFEEVDFNLNMMKLTNKRNCMLSYPVLKHVHGATTFSQLENCNEVFADSKQKFESKWNVKWEELRGLFNKNTIPQINKEQFNEWNSNIEIWG